MKILLTLTALALPYIAHAGQVSTTLTAFVEKNVTDSTGVPKVVLQEPKQVFPGDKIVYVLSYHNIGKTPAANFAFTDAIPNNFVFDGTPDTTALVSVDGGKTWGALATLRVAAGSGTRNARPEDVTNIRWALKTAIPAGAEGKLSFRGTVK